MTKRKEDVGNTAVPEWKEDFKDRGVDTLIGLGFEFLLCGLMNDGRTTMKRIEDGLTMYIEQDHTRGPQQPIMVNWMYISDSIKPKNMPDVTIEKVTNLFWSALLDGSSNSDLLLRSEELCSRNNNIRETRQLRELRETV